MLKWLEKIRKPITDRPLSRKIFDTFIIFMIGFIFGFGSKILDLVDLEIIHTIFLYYDLGAFFSRMSIWLLFALIISVVSKTPLRAAINVFVFFIGMLLSYYGYGYIIEGIFPQKVIAFWVILAIISPFLAVSCWYAKGNNMLSVCISSVLVAVFFVLAFAFDMNLNSFRLRHFGMEMINWLISLGVLYKSPKQFTYILLLSSIIGISVRFFYLLFLQGNLDLWVVQL